MRARAGVVMVAGLLAVLGLAACGDDDGDPLTKAGFIANGSAICERTQERIDQGATGFVEGEVPTFEQMRTFVDDTVAPAVKDELNELDDLQPPEEDREDVDEIIEEGEKARDAASTRPELLLNKDRSPFNRYAELASRYGLRNCGTFSEEVQRKLSGSRQ